MSSKRTADEPAGGAESKAVDKKVKSKSDDDEDELQEGQLRFAVVCSSNQNRSMEAHLRLKKNKFNVESYGSGNNVKLPGPSSDRPNVYEFGKSTYNQMYNDLKEQDEQLYNTNGVLNMLDRNRGIKPGPEKFQTCEKKFDVVITCESRVFDQVIQSLEETGSKDFEAVHVCNIDIKDNHDEAMLGAIHINELAEKLQAAEDLDDEVDDILQDFESNSGLEVLHQVAYY